MVLGKKQHSCTIVMFCRLRESLILKVSQGFFYLLLLQFPKAVIKMDEVLYLNL